MKTLTLEQYRKNFVALIILSLIIPVSALPQGQRKANTDNIKRKWLDVAYSIKSPAQKLDVYLPDEGEGLSLLFFQYMVEHLNRVIKAMDR